MRPLHRGAGWLVQLGVIAGTLLTSPGTSRPEAQALSFEAASVKANRSGEDRMSTGRSGSRYTALNAPLKFLILSALDISFEPARLIGGPEWIENERFDIAAAVPDGARP